MVDRNEAHKQWRKGIIGTPELCLVVKDLQHVVDVFYAMDRAADLSMVYLRMELESAKDMKRRRAENI